MRKVSFANDERYHVYNRGTEKRKIFLDKNDYERFLFIINSFNKASPGKNTSRSLERKSGHLAKNEKLVEIEHFCLMPNHYHFILRQVADEGISKFLQKVMTGYTMFFNKKYERTGVLFQGKAKSKYIDNDSYYRQLRAYIDLNPVELFDKSWKEIGRVHSAAKIIEKMKMYRYGSCKDYSTYVPYLEGKAALEFDELLPE